MVDHLRSKSSNKKFQFLTFKVNFLCQKLSKYFLILSLMSIIWGACLFIVNFCKRQFLKPFSYNYQAHFLIAELRTYDDLQNVFFMKNHSVKLPIYAEVAKKFLNGIYCTMRLVAQLFEILFEGALFTLKLRFSEKNFPKLHSTNVET